MIASVSGLYHLADNGSTDFSLYRSSLRPADQLSLEFGSVRFTSSSATTGADSPFSSQTDAQSVMKKTLLPAFNLLHHKHVGFHRQIYTPSSVTADYYSLRQFASTIKPLAGKTRSRVD